MKLKVPAAILAVGIMITGAYMDLSKIDLFNENQFKEQLLSYTTLEHFEVSDENEIQTDIQDQDDQIIINDVPHIQQMPELARGCEVTSLAMLLQYAGVSVDKMTLAEEITTVPFLDQYGLYGNPNEGFVGDIYTFENSGYGVYHSPIAELAESYLPDRIVDLTGQSIDSVYQMIRNGSPVWVIVNSRFNSLPEDEFQEWETESGDVQITYREHSVVVVGYDEDTVYINDPLAEEPYTAISRENFEAAWVQMGQQAVSYQ
ncbi:C39 family peptidase [Niallia oryzisoli]|uniref:C39 family peptidase n=1 Tax=Niallia oryzisoli TaxID=1737571 RepID=UPI003734CAC1